MFPRVIERTKEDNIYETHSVELPQELSAEQTFQILIKCIAVPQSIDLWSTCKVAEKHRTTGLYLYIFIVHYYKHYTNIIWHYNVVQSNLRFLASF